MNRLSKLKWQGEEILIRDVNSYPRRIKPLFIGGESAFLTSNALDIESDVSYDYGAGFNVAGLRGRTFLDLLHEVSDLEGITDIVIIGCADCVNTSSLSTAMEAFKDQAEELFPGARLTLSMADWDLRDQDRAKDLKSALIYYAAQYGYTYAPLDFYAQYVEYTDQYGRLEDAGAYAAAMLRFLTLGTAPHQGPVSTAEVETVSTTNMHVESYVNADQGEAVFKIRKTDPISIMSSVLLDGSSQIDLRSADFSTSGSGCWYGTLEGDARVIIATPNGVIVTDARAHMVAGRIYLDEVYQTSGSSFATVSISTIQVLNCTLTGLLFN